jgi:hypothetical protein
VDEMSQEGSQLWRFATSSQSLNQEARLKTRCYLPRQFPSCRRRSISPQATEHGKLGRFARGQSFGHVLGVIQAHAIRHVRLDRGMLGERGSERRRSDGWTAGKVRVGAEARRGKAGWQAKIVRVEAGNHSSRTSAGTVRLLCIEELHVSARRQEGASGLNQSERHASAAQATHPSAVRLSVDCQRVSSSANPASEVLIIPRVRPARARGPSSSSSPSPEPSERKFGRLVSRRPHPVTAAASIAPLPDRSTLSFPPP